MHADDASTLRLGRTRTIEWDESNLDERLTMSPEAFGDLYKLYLPRIYRYLRARSNSEEEAADLTQQVFLQALDAFPRYCSRGVPISAWLFRIARNAATDAHRRRKTTVEWDHLPEALHPQREPSLETDVINRESLVRLYLILSDLTPKKRELLALRFVAELSVREIALVTKKKPAAVHKQLMRTLQALKEQYHDE